eukprot:13545838-Alexandrium_andersonii.AAC.1
MLPLSACGCGRSGEGNDEHDAGDDGDAHRACTEGAADRPGETNDAAEDATAIDFDKYAGDRDQAGKGGEKRRSS